MLEMARRRLRADVAPGDSPADVEEKVGRAGPWLDEERRAALWLYGWHHAEARRPSPATVGLVGDLRR
jgi:hypothetical protein